MRVSEFGALGRILFVMGLVLAGLGALLVFAGRIPGLGRLPGDIVIQRGTFTFYAPIATMLLLSVVLSLLLRLLRR